MTHASDVYRGAVRRLPAIVVGSGIAGLSAALGLEQCVVLTRGRLGSGSSRHAQGGIAAALASGDSAADHAADTLAVSAGIADEEAVRIITAAAAGRIQWLTALGAHFDLDVDGKVSLGREAGHRTRRVVHAHGDATGAEVMRTLVAAVEARSDIEVLAGYDLVDLVLCGSRVVGVVVVSRRGEFMTLLAPVVVLATGGIGGLYARTTNPVEITGDGLAAAVRAGALLGDLEFVQFHPTALDVDADPAPLLTEALRGEGAVLIDDAGERFMVGVHPDAELAPRDVLARAIWRKRMEGSRVWLDSREAVGARFPQRFPNVWQMAQAAGLDPRSEPLPVTPAEHYFMGGIVTDLNGRSSLPGLWAVGEVGTTGLHGANRLASNSLLEGMVLGAAAARDIAASRIDPVPSAGLEIPADALSVRHSTHTARQEAIRRLMWERVGLVRDAHGLRTALAELDRLTGSASSSCLRDRNLLVVARLIATAALKRTESRGAHYRSDFPHTDPAQQQRREVLPLAVARVALARSGLRAA